MKTLSKQQIEKIRKDPNIHIQNWWWVSKYQKLSESFIKEFQDKVDWHLISVYQKLSENIIREFKDKVNWIYISAHQKLSEQFIYEFIDKINIDMIVLYQKHLSIETRNKIELIHKLQNNQEN